MYSVFYFSNGIFTIRYSSKSRSSKKDRGVIVTPFERIINFNGFKFYEPSINKRLYIQKLNFRESILEILEICMDEKSFDRFYRLYERNPFIINTFRFICQGLFISLEEKVEKKKRELTPFEKAVEERKKMFSESKGEDNVTFLTSLFKWIRDFSLEYDITDKITYTYFKSILSESKNIKILDDKAKAERESKNKNKKGNTASIRKKI